jgi:predicted DsbA family dithiol-disulfide isomerase
VRGVPFFVVDRAFAAQGAQSSEVLGQLLRNAWNAEHSVGTRAAG